MKHELETAVNAARLAGELILGSSGEDLTVNEATRHDIKLEMDVRSQELITNTLLSAFPDHAVLGEEGTAGNADSDFRWVVDPIDGTVNYFYGIPHFCVSIALQQSQQTMVGVIFDPNLDEMFTVIRGEDPSLNGSPIRVSDRSDLSDAILTVGFAKSAATIDSGLPIFEAMVRGARKVRMMGSAALGLAYVACGRLDAYIEQGIGLWDLAAGALLIESAGGKVKAEPRGDLHDKYAMTAWNGKLDLPLP